MCDGTSKQATCEAGHFSPGGDDECHPCGDNDQYSVAGAASCSTCGAGHYTTGGTNATRTACKPYEGVCDNGQLIDLALRTKHNHCGSCHAGHFLEDKACKQWAGQCANGTLIEQARRIKHGHCGSCDAGQSICDLLATNSKPTKAQVHWRDG